MSEDVDGFLAHRGLGLHNDLQTEHSVVGNLVFAHLLHLFGSPARGDGGADHHGRARARVRAH